MSQSFYTGNLLPGMPLGRGGLWNLSSSFPDNKITILYGYLRSVTYLSFTPQLNSWYCTVSASGVSSRGCKEQDGMVVSCERNLEVHRIKCFKNMFEILSDLIASLLKIM